MALTRVWSKGQVTIPAPFRKQLHLEDNSPLNILMIGGTLVLIPYKTQGTKLAGKFEKEMEKNHISFDDLLEGLRKTRKEVNQERYGV